MVWKTRLIDIEQVDTRDSANVSVEFYDGPRLIRKQFTLTAGQFANRAAVKDFFHEEQRKLNRHDSITVDLRTLVGSEDLVAAL